MIRKTEDIPRVEAVHRALVLLKLMADTGSLGVTEAAAALDVNPSTAQRLLATMAGDGFAVQGERRRYSPGPAFLRPGTKLASQSLRARARPFLERLFQRTGETVHLASLIGVEVHHLDGIEATAAAIRFGLRTGVVLPAHVTSSGKAMLAELPGAELDLRYRGTTTAGHLRDGRPAPFDVARLRRQLALTREKGIGSNLEESEPDVAAFGVSLGVIAGERAAFSVALPLSRCTTDDIERFTEPLLQTADEFRTHLRNQTG